MEKLRGWEEDQGDSTEDPPKGLKRDLGLLHATMLGIGNTVSAGIFVTLGIAVGMAGPAVVLAFLLAGLINLATVFSYCELGAAMPKAGGEYAYVKEAFGGLLAFLTGWFEWSSNVFYAALMVLGSAYLISHFMPIEKLWVAIALVAAFALINIRGIREAGTAETLLVSALLAVLFLYAGAGLAHGFRPNAFEPFMPSGPLGVLAATAFIFESFLGVEAVAATQAEIKRPGRTIPRAMILSSLVLIIVYLLVVYVTVGVAPPDVLSRATAPLVAVAEKTMGGVGAALLTFAGLLAALTSLNSALIASSRAAYAMSLDGYFPRILAKVHERFRTPHAAIVFCSVLIALFSAVGTLEFVVYSINFGFLMGYSLVNLSLIKLRRSKPHMHRPFKVPLYPLTPLAGIATSSLLLAFFKVEILMFNVAWAFFGLTLYFIAKVMPGFTSLSSRMAKRIEGRIFRFWVSRRRRGT